MSAPRIETMGERTDVFGCMASYFAFLDASVKSMDDFSKIAYRGAELVNQAIQRNNSAIFYKAMEPWLVTMAGLRGRQLAQDIARGVKG